MLASAMDFVMTGGLRGLGTITRPITTLLLVGKVQGIVQGASKEGILFMGLRRQEHRSRTKVPWLPSNREEGSAGLLTGIAFVFSCLFVL